MTSTCYGSLAAIIGAQFFSRLSEATRNIFALLAFAAGFLVRPFGALVFGRLGDLVGRKYTFLVTILIMGVSTFLVGLLPGSTIGIAAPIILIICACCRAWRSVANMAVRRPMSRSMRRTTPRLLHVLDPDHRDRRSLPVARRDPVTPLLGR